MREEKKTHDARETTEQKILGNFGFYIVDVYTILRIIWQCYVLHETCLTTFFVYIDIWYREFKSKEVEDKKMYGVC